MEIWDAYDEKGNKIDGVSLVRGEPIREIITLSVKLSLRTRMEAIC